MHQRSFCAPWTLLCSSLRLISLVHSLQVDQNLFPRISGSDIVFRNSEYNFTTFPSKSRPLPSYSVFGASSASIKSSTIESQKIQRVWLSLVSFPVIGHLGMVQQHSCACSKQWSLTDSDRFQFSSCLHGPVVRLQTSPSHSCRFSNRNEWNWHEKIFQTGFM